MPAPRPDVELKGHCSVVHDGTLYTYSPDAFQALELRPGGEWSQLDRGVQVTGAACVRVIPDGDLSKAALYLVGGSVDPSITHYPGLERWSFTEKRWEWIWPVTSVTTNRRNHGATYLPASQEILIYSGSQETGSSFAPSSETFVISVHAPHAVRALSATAPPVVAPMLMPWNESHAVMLGGGAQNKQVFLFGPDRGWSDLGPQLAEGFRDQSSTRASIVTGGDGSKILEIFNMGVSPNQVTGVVLANGDGSAASPSQTGGERPAKRRRRDINTGDWPAYNSTSAPTTTRSGFSIAQDENGVAFITGGNADDPLSIFDQRENTWLDAASFFEGDQVVVISSFTSVPASRPIPSSTSTPTSSSTAAATTPVAPGPNKSRMLTVLGATLGAIFGIAAISIILLLLLRWKRQRRKRAGGGGYVEKDRNRLSFQDQGAEFMSEAGGSIGHSYTTSKNISQSSIAIMSGKIPSGHKRGLGPHGSDASTAGLMHKKSPLAYNDPVELTRIGEEQEVQITEKPVARIEPPPPAAVRDPTPLTAESPPRRTRSSGWSRYFTNNQATNLARMPSGRSTYASDLSRSSAGSHSEYTNSACLSQPSQIVAPLDLHSAKYDGQRLGQVPTGSLTPGRSQEHVPGSAAAFSNSLSAHPSRPHSDVSSVSSFGDHNHGSSTSGATGLHTGATTWDPVSDPVWNARPVSSVYTESLHGSPHLGKDAPSSFYSAQFGPKSATASRLIAGGVQQGDRGSTMTVFPGGVPEPGMPVRQAAKGNVPPPRPERTDLGHQDMSWLKF
ncbi:hypothetical protein W97_00685 [Coniosporium apollinis CBS 100218]|uniref:Pre-mRNA splicing factor CLF1 n=1 Tax=Coniosporium apollinis (strain CBS 100218) TaxID=1168221 RepID=R7YHU3_CONA1|nr:uncharacterized protein W97_00685 [Coniosporium apollinis CBS 100218]EON61470.1 hypothetical protein W97_00685 [Coniosporium apollinis CBS 100218]